MADARLQIIIEALNKASDDLGKLKKDIQGVGDSSKQAEGGVKKFGGGLSSMVGKVAIASAAIAAVGVALKQVYTAAKEGAELQYTATRFENLAKAVGTTADALKNDMRDATSGMMSDAELMASAADFMALGLAKSHDEVVRLSSVAGQLGMDMNQLVLTLTNQTTMRFDALGVSVDGFDAKVKALEASGMSVQDAFTEAFLQQAEEQILKVGSASDSTIGDFKRLEAAAQNLGNSIKTNLADQLSGVVGQLATTMQAGVDFHAALDEAVKRGAISQNEYAEILGKVRNGLMDQGDAVDYVKGKTTEFEGAIETANLDVGYYNDMVEIAAAMGEEWAIQLLAEKDAAEEAADAARQLADDLQKYSDKALFAKASSQLSAEQAYGLAVAMGLIDENTAFANEKLAEYKSMLDNGQISVSEYKALVKGLADEIARLEGKDVDINVNVNYTTSGELPLNEDWVIDNDDFDKPTATGGQRYKGDPYRWQEYGYRGEVFVPSEDGFVLSRADAMRAVAMGKGTRGFATGGALSTKDPVYPSGYDESQYLAPWQLYGMEGRPVYGQQPDAVTYSGRMVITPAPEIEGISTGPGGPPSKGPTDPSKKPKSSTDPSVAPKMEDISRTSGGPLIDRESGGPTVVRTSGGASGSYAGSIYKQGGSVTVNYYTLSMPTSNNPIDVAMAFDLMQAYGGI